MGDLDDTAAHETEGEVRLTPHRRELLLRLFAGETPHEIARALGRSPSTVSNTIATIRKRLGVRRDVDALREALRQGIVTLEEIEQRRVQMSYRDGKNSELKLLQRKQKV